jgi:hypothetical protein
MYRHYHRHATPKVVVIRRKHRRAAFIAGQPQSRADQLSRATRKDLIAAAHELARRMDRDRPD